ncbi:MAG: protease inhibitor [Rhizobiaceae bacterium]|nr:protease inhibitor [Rhizobiaceae bacterium]
MSFVGNLLRRPAAYVLLLVGILASCTVVVEQPRPGPAPRPQCTNQHAPVCGQRGTTLRTFTNACHARANDFVVVANGECGRMTHPRVCTREVIPVCAERGNRRQTFSNACLAAVEGYRVVHGGRCR